MLKILLLIAVFVSVYFIFFRKKDKSVSHDKKDQIEGDELIPCSVCGTLVSEKEILISDGKYFCSKECLNNR
jgi:uncharacterized protein